MTLDPANDESLCRSILDSLTDHIVVLDHSGAIIAVNDAWKRFAVENGAANNPLVEAGANYLSICKASATIAPEASDAIDGIQRVLSGSLPRFSQDYSCHSSSEQRWYHMEVLPFAGGRAGAVVTHQDITQRRIAEEQRRETEELLRTLINATPDIICFKDEAGRWLQANTSILDLYHLQGVSYQHKAEPELADYTAPIYTDAFRNCEHSDDLAWQNDRLTRSEEIIPDVEGNKHVYDVIKVPLFHSNHTRKGLVVFGRDITDLKLAETRIRTSLKEKEVLLKEVHHRVKNNMQVISSLLALHKRRCEDPQARRLLEEAESRVRSMALVHETLYNSELLAEVPFKAYLHELTSRLASHHRGVPPEIHIDAEDIHVGIGVAVPAGLIVNELVTNSLSHAFPGGIQGRIDVSLRSVGSICTLLVMDNGGGFPEGVDHRTPATLGLQLVTTLAEQLHGTIDFQTGQGTRWTIVFPLPED